MAASQKFAKHIWQMELWPVVAILKKYEINNLKINKNYQHIRDKRI